MMLHPLFWEEGFCILGFEGFGICCVPIASHLVGLLHPERHGHGERCEDALERDGDRAAL